jgi:hypothetical protein
MSKLVQVPFVCSETIELGEELVGSNPHKVHLYRWLKFNNYDRPVTQGSIYKG